MFSSQSFGFRPSLSCHHAIEETHKYLSGKDGYTFVVEIDFANFFNSVNHRKLMKMLRKKIANKKLLSLIHRLLMANIQHENGNITQAVVGTPQGGIASPILANVYLHYVVDKWFQDRYGKVGKMVRYADDGLFFFKNAQAAESFLQEFKQRVLTYKLKLNNEKTKIINMSKEAMESFDFLGFTFYKGRNRKSRGRLVMIKTSKDKLIKTISNLTSWIKKNRCAMKTNELMRQLNIKLRGHYNYFGYWCNYISLHRIYRETRKALFKWLNRRSQLKSLNLEKFKLLAERTILAPEERFKLRKLGWSPYV
jgi:group II intron reverse transcriptase/maturase